MPMAFLATVHTVPLFAVSTHNPQLSLCGILSIFHAMKCSVYFLLHPRSFTNYPLEEFVHSMAD